MTLAFALAAAVLLRGCAAAVPNGWRTVLSPVLGSVERRIRQARGRSIRGRSKPGELTPFQTLTMIVLFTLLQYTPATVLGPSAEHFIFVRGGVRARRGALMRRRPTYTVSGRLIRNLLLRYCSAAKQSISRRSKASRRARHQLRRGLLCLARNDGKRRTQSETVLFLQGVANAAASAMTFAG